jgi:hypothetical protein
MAGAPFGINVTLMPLEGLNVTFKPNEWGAGGRGTAVGSGWLALGN